MINILEVARGENENILVICGTKHMVPIYHDFIQRNIQASMVDATRAPWFSGQLNTDWLFE
jgi:hypothetical protein